jgi:hypothetical protein
MGPVSERVLAQLLGVQSHLCECVAFFFFFHAHSTWRTSRLLAACFASSSSWSFSAKVHLKDTSAPCAPALTPPPLSSLFFFPSLLEATAYGVQLYGAGSPNPSAVMAEWATAYKYHRDDVTYVSFSLLLPFFGSPSRRPSASPTRPKTLPQRSRVTPRVARCPLFPQLVEFCRAVDTVASR